MKATTRLWAITNSIVQTGVPDAASAESLRFAIGLANAVYHTALATNAATAATTIAKKFMPCLGSPSVRVLSLTRRAGLPKIDTRTSKIPGPVRKGSPELGCATGVGGTRYPVSDRRLRHDGNFRGMGVSLAP